MSDDLSDARMAEIAERGEGYFHERTATARELLRRRSADLSAEGRRPIRPGRSVLGRIMTPDHTCPTCHRPLARLIWGIGYYHRLQRPDLCFAGEWRTETLECNGGTIERRTT
jgi:hypothetical protein